MRRSAALFICNALLLCYRVYPLLWLVWPPPFGRCRLLGVILAGARISLWMFGLNAIGNNILDGGAVSRNSGPSMAVSFFFRSPYWDPAGGSRRSRNVFAAISARGAVGHVFRKRGARVPRPAEVPPAWFSEEARSERLCSVQRGVHDSRGEGSEQWRWKVVRLKRGGRFCGLRCSPECDDSGDLGPREFPSRRGRCAAQVCPNCVADQRDSSQTTGEPTHLPRRDHRPKSS